MDRKKPATSTPNNYLRLSGRSSIRGEDNISPILPVSPKLRNKFTRSGSSTSLHSYYSGESDEETQEHTLDLISLSISKNLKFQSDIEKKQCLKHYDCETINELCDVFARIFLENNRREEFSEAEIMRYVDLLKSQVPEVVENEPNYLGFGLLVMIVAVIITLYLYMYESSASHEAFIDYSNDKFSQDFPNQHEDLWFSIESGINDAKLLNRPSTFIFLYTNDREEETVEKLINNLGIYATCYLTKCQDPLIIEGKSLNDFKDYGEIITKYKDDLKKTGVMIVKNLEQINHNSALAFHTICDQYQPLIPKSIIVFTMKIDKFVPTALNTQHCENILRNKWFKMPDDKFFPLYTRLSNVIYNIMP